MSVASWLQASGTSASFISNTTEPSALLIRLDLLVHLMVEKTSVPAWVNRLVIRMVLHSFCGRPAISSNTLSVTHPRWCVSPDDAMNHEGIHRGAHSMLNRNLHKMPPRPTGL